MPNNSAPDKPPWTTATGLVVRGYVSKIDGSVQPYGLVVPATFQERTPHRFRLDVWCHGRGETLSEVNFITGRQSSPGEFTPTNAFVLHPYGRFCNAAKFAGEVDVFEALGPCQAALSDRRRSAGDARVFDGGRRLLAFCHALSQHLGSRGTGRRFLRNARLPQDVPGRNAPSHLVRTQTLAPVRLHGLRDQPVQLPDRGL